jgi:hypothetical protein
MERLGGLVKYAIHHKGGVARLTHLAAACATEVEVVQVGIMLWEAMGQLEVEQSEGEVRISQARAEPDQTAVEIYRDIFQRLIDEVNAYREYFSRAGIENLIIDRKL